MSELDLVQVEALRQARGKRGFGYFLQMGLGKTLTALEEFRRGSAIGRPVAAVEKDGAETTRLEHPPAP